MPSPVPNPDLQPELFAVDRAPVLLDVIPQFITVSEIARRNGHRRMSVYKAIARLNIKPALSWPVRLYHPAVAEQLKEAMYKAWRKNGHP